MNNLSARPENDSTECAYTYVGGSSKHHDWFIYDHFDEGDTSKTVVCWQCRLCGMRYAERVKLGNFDERIFDEPRFEGEG